jgi:hypothetical protein
MPLFIVSMLAGLAGLVVMAVPGLFRHGGGHANAGHAGHGVHLARSQGHAASGHGGSVKSGTSSHPAVHAGHAARHGAFRTPSILEVLDPRLLCSLAALFGASGEIGIALGLGQAWSALLAVPAAVGLEWAIVGRLWRFALGFQGRPASPMDALLFEVVEAVTAFHNGKGMVRAIRDGRSVQLVAHLQANQEDEAVRTGDRLRVLEVDPENERVTVTRT